MQRLREYLSFSGSFSRVELLISAVVLGAAAYGIGALSRSFPEARVLTYPLYPLWGLALGKRSRDLGLTFTYGVIIGMIISMVFPAIGLLFLFQKGAKEKAAAAEKPEATPGS